MPFVDTNNLKVVERLPAPVTKLCLREATGSLIPWTPALSNGGATITFTAPSLPMLLPGDSFYINIYFSGDEGSSIAFTGG
jgi:hypothetical protein